MHSLLNQIHLDFEVTITKGCLVIVNNYVLVVCAYMCVCVWGGGGVERIISLQIIFSVNLPQTSIFSAFSAIVLITF